MSADVFFLPPLPLLNTHTDTNTLFSFTLLSLLPPFLFLSLSLSLPPSLPPSLSADHGGGSRRPAAGAADGDAAGEPHPNTVHAVISLSLSLSLLSLSQ